jgi:hypothetical protein
MGGIARTLAALTLAVAGLAVNSAASAETALAKTVPAVSAAITSTAALGGIWCGSQKSCIAVGEGVAGGHVVPLAETWNGSTWKKVALSVPVGFLSTLSCASKSHCVAVGQYLNDRALAYTWTGTVWKPSEPPGPVGPSTYLISVSCHSAASCVAVGSEQGQRSSVAYSDILSGTTWVGKPVPIPKGTFLSQLGAVSCSSATFCVAVGYAVSTAGAISVLLDKWNGKAWSAMKPAALPAGFHGHVLAGVSCLSPTSCVAVGEEGKPSDLIAVSEIWNGKAWRYVNVAWPKGVKNAHFNDVHCLSAAHCVAVGATGLNPLSNYPTGRAAAAVWNGKAWKAESVPAPAKGKFSVFYGLSCQKSFCAAVGQTGPSDTPSGTSLSGFTTGSSWRLVPAK